MTRHNGRKWLGILNKWVPYLKKRSRSKDWSCALCEASENRGGEKPISLREVVDLMFDICGQKQWTSGLSRSNERTATCSRFRCICMQPNRNNHRSSNHRTLHRGNDGLRTQSSQSLALIGKSTNSNERQHVITCNTTSKTRPSIQKARSNRCVWLLVSLVWAEVTTQSLAWHTFPTTVHLREHSARMHALMHTPEYVLWTVNTLQSWQESCVIAKLTDASACTDGYLAPQCTNLRSKSRQYTPLKNFPQLLRRVRFKPNYLPPHSLFTKEISSSPCLPVAIRHHTKKLLRLFAIPCYSISSVVNFFQRVPKQSHAPSSVAVYLHLLHQIELDPFFVSVVTRKLHATMLITTRPTSTKQRQAIGSRQLASFLIFVPQFPAVTVSQWIKWQPQEPVNSWLAVQAPIPPSVSQTMSIFRATNVHPVQKEHIHRNMWLRSQIMLDISRMVEGVFSN